MSNVIASIPTMYRGIEFRSRLEAKWACFFDLCEWKWVYEPMDLNGWIPDFALGERPTLVEIKPYFAANEWGDVIRKTVASGYTEPVVLLGCDPTFRLGDELSGVPAMGWIAEPLPHLERYEIQDLHFGFTAGNDKLGLCPVDSGWVNYVWSVPEKRARYPNHPNKWARVWDGIKPGQVREILLANWAAASNYTQWRPRNESHPPIAS